ncbi:MAG TPA: CYTH domain-containing protein [Flavobacterium sp.]|nr:CYTH domain-containing protein [Flavobacterium sp.]
MGVEIERKFLVDKEKWAAIEKSAPNRMRQGYLLTDPHKTIRVRMTDTGGYITIKGLSTGATRTEFEYEIPKHEAEELLNLFSVSELDKIRYEITFSDKVWEVDEFLGENEGLIVAEIELMSESEEFELPGWITREVTDEEKYYNSSLSVRPFKRW